MANLIPLAYADLELQLAAAISAAATTFTLSSATDDDGNALPAGKYCFTINNGASNKQYLMGQLNGVTVTSVVTVSRQGVESSGAQYAARVGDTAIVTDFATIQRVADVLRGQIALDGDNPIVYDAEPTLTDRKEFATVAYVLDNISGGTVAFDSQIVTGVNAGETVAAGDLVYFKTSDQEFYLVDATLTAEVNGVQLGIALGAGTDGVAITGGVQISGSYTTTGLTAGSAYYASDTPGSYGTSAGTVNRVIGVALSTTELLMVPVNPETLTSDVTGALVGSGNTPTSTNTFVTTDDLSDDTFKPPQVVPFTASGTWTKDAGLKYISVEVQAPGGGGGGAGVGDTANGGGGGGYSRKIILSSTLGSTETVTIGAVGAGGTASNIGGTGGATSFGTHATAGGGGGGDDEIGSPGAGGIGASGDVNIQGGGGSNGEGPSASRSGSGGSSHLGGGAKGESSGGAGAAGGQYGGGGGGAEDNTAGGAGGAGIVIVTEYYS